MHYRKASGRSVAKAFNKEQTFPRLPFADKRFIEDLQQIFISLELFIFCLFFSYAFMNSFLVFWALFFQEKSG
jgi:hypothetical protein